MRLQIARYMDQAAEWPESGRHILAQYDESSVIVYQAYNPSIGRFAARHGYFGGEFSYTRMSWCKPNFLWMMYRSGWGTKEGQEVTLAVRLKRSFFDTVLAQAIPSSYDRKLFSDKAAWTAAVASSDVRLQWDPDHSPSGLPLQRRAIQLGLRGEILHEYGREAILDIEDISNFVAEQRVHAVAALYEELRVPVERIYKPSDAAVATELRLEE